jgi:NAD(P)-dependent dehydrogenase (short-subunit alcohol dehydrogenase family)
MTRRLEGRTVLITGGNRGIGREASRRLAGEGARVLLVSRNEEAGQEVAREIRMMTGNQEVEAVQGDLSTRESVRALASRVHSATDQLDVLLNNAAVVSGKRRVTPDGLELQFAVNHMAPFLLTRLLLPLLQAGAPSRVVTVSSRAHQGARMNWDDLQGEGRYRRSTAYAQSKLANILFTRELARRLESTGITALCMHPGVYATGILADLVGPLGKVVNSFLPGPEAGGEFLAELAADPALTGVTGVYFNRNTPAEPSREARDPEAARRLWEISSQLVGLPVGIDTTPPPL